MKLMIEFRYQCEMEITEKELDRVKGNLKKDKPMPDFSKEINDVLFTGDGRAERGGIVDYDYEIEED